MTDALTIRSDNLAHETIDGETIVIDMERQAYFRLEGAAALAWQALAQGCTEAALLAHLLQAYPASADMVAEALPTFLATLRQNGLTVAATTESGPLPAPATGAPFTGLTMHSFADLEEILWVDPVHDVDDATGWPTLPAAR